MFLAGWGTMSWQGTMNNFFRKKAGAYGRNNRGRFFDPKTADMLTAANSEMDETKRNKLRWAASEYLYSTYFVIPLYYQENVIGFSKRIGRQGPEPTNCCWRPIGKRPSNFTEQLTQERAGRTIAGPFVR